MLQGNKRGETGLVALATNGVRVDFELAPDNVVSIARAALG